MYTLAQIRTENREKNDIVVELDLSDLQALIDEATRNIDDYKDEIAMIYDKMPQFDYIYFCFYAYSTYRLLEATFNIDIDKVGHIRVDAPEAFFYAFYGMIQTLHSHLVTEESRIIQ